MRQFESAVLKLDLHLWIEGHDEHCRKMHLAGLQMEL
jgi:hypothetical protein